MAYAGLVAGWRRTLGSFARPDEHHVQQVYVKPLRQVDRGRYIVVQPQRRLLLPSFQDSTLTASGCHSHHRLIVPTALLRDPSLTLANSTKHGKANLPYQEPQPHDSSNQPDDDILGLVVESDDGPPRRHMNGLED